MEAPGMSEIMTPEIHRNSICFARDVSAQRSCLGLDVSYNGRSSIGSSAIGPMVTLKVQVNKEFFRWPLPEPSFDAIVQLVFACHPDIKALHEGALIYKDDDGDWCTLTCSTFPDFLEQKGNGVLKLKLKPKTSKDVHETPRPEVSSVALPMSQEHAEEEGRTVQDR